MKRSPLQRRTPLKARRSHTFTKARCAAVAAAAARDGYSCVARHLAPLVACGGPLDGHEPLTRGRGGDPLDVDNILTVCRSHHDHLHAHPAWAESVGLLKRQEVA